MKIKRTIYSICFKRIFDIIFSLTAIILLIPVFIIVAILVKIKLGSPVIFKHKRPGKNEKIFTVYKFRTMTNDRDENGELLPDNIRLTKFGRKLRDLSLDELPELFNILIGNMSLIGPRPLHRRFLPRYNEVQKLRHKVKPGLTGLAQINGRNSITWEEKFSYDVDYAKKITFFKDFCIFFKTIFVVLSRSGVNQEEDVTMEEFLGTPNNIE